MKVSNFSKELLEQFEGVIYDMLDAYIRSNYEVIKVEDTNYLCSGENDYETIEHSLIDFLNEKGIDTDNWSIAVECNNLELMNMYEFSISVLPSEEIENANDDELCDECQATAEKLLGSIADEFENDIKQLLHRYFGEKYGMDYTDNAASTIFHHQWNLVTDALKITEPKG